MADGLVPSFVATLIRVLLLVVIGWHAYSIRLHALKEFGMVIHEFDPWFNYRATEYLAHNGAERFFKWYDYEVWYPLGRPVGTTIYPGMQFTSVYIWRVLGALGSSISLNDVCCYVPAWFGVVATMFLGLLAREATGSSNAGVAAAAVMAIVPAHLMRSVGGGYDNESVAISALCATFYLWVLALRTRSIIVAAISGLAYFYMVAAWGGYIFVINMIGMHAAVMAIKMVALGNYESYLHRAFTVFYVVGTFLAVQVPVVGWTPLRSLEQLGAFGVFGVLQLLELCDVLRRRQGLETDQEIYALRVRVFTTAAAAAAVVAGGLSSFGYFGPLSSRIRGLFVPHTRTGNPLVDSVAEHQPARPEAYFQMLHMCCLWSPFGFVMMWFKRNDSKLFVALFTMVCYHFSSKMSRLLLLMGPVCSILTGAVIAGGSEWAVAQIYAVASGGGEDDVPAVREAGVKGKGRDTGKGAKERASGASKAKARKVHSKGGIEGSFEKVFGPFEKVYRENPAGRALVGGLLLIMFTWNSFSFYGYSQMMAEHLSHPSIMFKANVPGGMIDDYREAYWWLRDNTPKDSRVMAWWDYGYQINGIANRTTIADGNTWNHEHIATLGRCLASPTKDAHAMIRHLADYVLVWAGSGGDDLAKSPHMARIGNSVFSDICPGDPTCTKFGFKGGQGGGHTDGEPTPMMRASLLYNLHGHNKVPGVHIDEMLFQESMTSKYGKVRIFKVMGVSEESKSWIADPANRKCDAPGSWYCTGQYPPALDSVIKRRKAFKQLEDFNVEGDEEAEQYQKSYMQRMGATGG